MNKLRLLLVTALALFALIGCKATEFGIDGEFTAYEASIYNNAPQVTMVTVTIEDGEIVGYYIDARQGISVQTAGDDTPEDTSDDRYTFTWKEMTKKELGEDYGMDDYGGAVADWHIQAQRIEAFWLENGVDSVTVDANGKIDNVAGVTIRDESYTSLASEAVELARMGKFQTIYCTADDLYSATMTVSRTGKVSDLVFDGLQGDPSGETFAWREKTKQELAFEYGMKDVGPGYEYTDGAWVASGEKSALEWHEQARLLADYVMEHGYHPDLQHLGGRGGSLDGETLIEDLAGVTISSGHFYIMLANLYSLPSPDELK